MNGQVNLRKVFNMKDTRIIQKTKRHSEATEKSIEK